MKEKLEKLKKLIKFLDDITDINEDIRISAGDLLGYLKGYFDDDCNPKDEIETFN